MIDAAQAKKLFSNFRKRCEEYRKSADGYLRFAIDWLDVKEEHVWGKMEDVFIAVHEKPKTAVRAGHSVSKSYSSARVALSFLIVNSVLDGEAVVITTAPTHKQVEDILWREIQVAWKAFRLRPVFEQGGARLTKTKLDLGGKAYAHGFTATPDAGSGESSAFAGRHSRNLLIVFDEASGEHPAIWRAAQGMLASSGEGMRQVWLAIGNPLEAMSEFHRAFSDPSWHTIHISVHDTPNYKEGRTVIPGLAGREFENDIIHKYGRDSNEHLVRVLGEFPRYSEGTFWGREMALAREEQRIISFPHERELPVYAFWDIGDIHTVILFVQFVQRWIHILDHYYDSDGAGLPAAAQHIKQLPYTIEGHWCGPDLWSTNRKSFQTGMETVEVARSLGIRFQPVYRHRFQDGIEAVRTIFNQIKINTNLCGDVITAISQYKKKGNPITSQPGKPAFHDHPVKNWTCHFADALRHLAMVYRHQPISGRMLGRVTPQEAEILAEIGYTTHDDYPIDLEVA